MLLTENFVILASRSGFDPVSNKRNDRVWRALKLWMCCWDYPAAHSQQHCWLAPERWIIQVLFFKPIISLCLLLMCIYYSMFSSAQCLLSNRFLPFVPLQHVGVTMDRCRLKWTVQTGGTATAASTLTLVTPSGKGTSLTDTQSCLSTQHDCATSLLLSSQNEVIFKMLVKRLSSRPTSALR